MKDLITCVASVMLLMVFLQQFVLNQTTYARLAGAENAAKEFRIELEDSGDRELDAGDVRVRNLKERIAACVGCEPSEVSFSINKISENEGHDANSASSNSLDSSDGAGGGSSEDSSGSEGSDTQTRIASTTYGYEISMPVRNIIGSADFLGITDEENQVTHTIRQTAKIEEEIEEVKEKGDSKKDEGENSSESPKESHDTQDTQEKTGGGNEQHDTNDSDAHIDGLTS